MTVYLEVQQSHQYKISCLNGFILTLTRDNIAQDFVRGTIRKLRPQTKVWTDEQLAASLDKTLNGRNTANGVWVFGYGSLLWNPAFDFEERRTAKIHGWRRQFCMRAPTGRGSPDFPGLLLALESGGSCWGEIYRIAPNKIGSELRILWWREMVVGSYRPIWVKAHSNNDIFEAITFAMNTKHASYVTGQSDEEIANVIVKAVGELGPNIDYLNTTLDYLNKLGLSDHRLKRLHHRANVLSAGLGR